MKHLQEFRANIVRVFIRARHQAQRLKMNGIYKAAIERGWQIQIVDDVFSSARMNEPIASFRPLGCLIDASSYPSNGFRKIKFPQIPIVLLGKDSHGVWRHHDCTAQNTRAPAVAAARRFRELGLRSFTFVGDSGKVFWSVERGRHFANAVRSWAFHAYKGPSIRKNKGIGALARHLTALERPFGVFLAADYLAVPLYAAADKAGLTIGKDLFVIGVDDDELICKSLSPALSSVSLDFSRGGSDAIGLLAQRLEDPAAPPRCQTYVTFGVVNRASSTRQMSDARLNRGLTYIQEHGCEAIKSEDVARRMNCSRRMAEILVKRHLGKTILDCIRETRLEKAKFLLENTDHPIDSIPSLCGYESLAHMKAYFRQQTGMTMRDWRKKRVARD